MMITNVKLFWDTASSLDELQRISSVERPGLVCRGLFLVVHVAIMVPTTPFLLSSGYKK
jgi:hypothetical protein